MSNLFRIANFLNKKYFTKTASISSDGINLVNETFQKLRFFLRKKMNPITITLHGIKAKSPETGEYNYSPLEGKTIYIPNDMKILKEFVNSPYHDYLNSNYTKIIDDYYAIVNDYAEHIDFLNEIKRYHLDMINIMNNRIYHISSDNDNFYLLDSHGKKIGSLEKLPLFYIKYFFEPSNSHDTLYGYCHSAMLGDNKDEVFEKLIKKDEHIEIIINNIKLFLSKNKKILDELSSIMEQIDRPAYNKNFYFKNYFTNVILFMKQNCILTSDDTENVKGEAFLNESDWENLVQKIKGNKIPRKGGIHIVVDSNKEAFIKNKTALIYDKGELKQTINLDKKPVSEEDFKQIIGY